MIQFNEAYAEFTVLRQKLPSQYSSMLHGAPARVFDAIGEGHDLEANLDLMRALVGLLSTVRGNDRNIEESVRIVHRVMKRTEAAPFLTPAHIDAYEALMTAWKHRRTEELLQKRDEVIAVAFEDPRKTPLIIEVLNRGVTDPDTVRSLVCEIERTYTAVSEGIL